MSLKLAIQLLDEQFISHKQFADVIRNYEASKLSEIAVALRLNLVTTGQTRRILDAQNEVAGESFCEIAVRLGILTERHCRQIRNMQDATGSSIPRILVDLRICTSNQVSVLDRSLRLCQGNSAEHPPTPKFSRRTRNAKTTAALPN